MSARGLVPITSTSVTLALIGTGASSMIWQVASARAIMAGLRGDELTLGLVLGSWLLLSGLATALTAAVLPSRGRAGVPTGSFVVVSLALMPLGILLSLGLLYSLLPAYRIAGEALSPLEALLWALLCLLPACALVGAAFGAITLMRPDRAPPGIWAAKIYFLESLGVVAAGLIFHHWLAHQALTLTALAAAGIPWLIAMALFLGNQKLHRPVNGLSLATGALSLLALTPGALPPLSPLLTPSIPGYSFLARENSRHGALAVLQRGDQKLFLSNGLTVFSNQDHRQAEQAVHPTLLAHPRPWRVLMIGGGLGGGLAALLDHPVRRVDYVELDPRLLALARSHMAPTLTHTLDDHRVHLELGDGRLIVARRTATYDLILVGLKGPNSALVNRYYTEDFFRSARRSLREGGQLRITLAASEGYLTHDQALVHATINSSLKRIFGNVAQLMGQPTLLIASRGAVAVNTDFSVLWRRYERRRITATGFGRGELMDRCLPLKGELYRERLNQVSPLQNTDLHPRLYFHAALGNMAASSPRLALGLRRLARRISDWTPWILAATFALPLCLALLCWRPLTVRVSLAAVGFSGVAVELSLMLAAQSVRGVIYHELGLLLTSFMAGVAAGSSLGGRLTRAAPRRALLVTVLGCALASLIAAAGLLLLRMTGQGSLWALLAMMLLGGGAVGAVYAPAVAALSRTLGHGAPATAYAWDLAGAAAGAVLSAGLALPLLGLPGTCLLGASLCLGCGGALWARAIA